MLAEPADQQKLLNIADLDAEMGRLQHTARTLPQHQRIAELMAERQVVADSFVESTTVVDDLRVALRRAEGDLVPVRSRLERDRTRVGDGSISDGKTLKGLIDEVARIERRIVELEDVEFEIMARLEDAETRAQELADRRGEVETILRDEVSVRDQKVKGLSAEAQGVAAARKDIVQTVPPALLALYEKIRAQRGLAAAKLHRGRCSGCQLEIPVADLDGYRKTPANEVIRCIECDRILVRTADSGL
ncbi:zinc ribbon domain-containing protein [Tessaracoccus sp.]